MPWITAFLGEVRDIRITSALGDNGEKKKRLSGLRAAVTGGTSGLGLALVQKLRAEGAEVALVARTTERVNEVAREFGAHGVVGDVAVKEERTAWR